MFCLSAHRVGILDRAIGGRPSPPGGRRRIWHASRGNAVRNPHRGEASCTPLAASSVPCPGRAKAPPCMRWRGLRRPRRASEPMTRRPVRDRDTTGNRTPPEGRRSPSYSDVPEIALRSGSPSAVNEFLLPLRCSAQGLRRVITRFFCLSTGYAALIHRTPLENGPFPQPHAQPYPQACSRQEQAAAHSPGLRC